MNEPLIEVRGLAYRYEDGTQALAGVNFKLWPGETVALLGPNGSGKTTFALHLVGLLEGASGEITVCGLKLGRATLSAIRRKIGFVFQDPDEQLFMPTVIEDVAFGLLSRAVAAGEARRKALEALSQVGMSGAANRAPYHLSAGEKRRVAIAGVLAMTPEILIFDEPTTYLDPPGQRELLDLMLSLPQSKVIITHDVPFARRVAARATFFQSGTIAAEGPLDETIARFAWDLSR
jgi:cobalt/nickel transport system ATP-binding protein